MFVRCSVHATPKKWKSWLLLTKFWYNTSYHSSLGCTPFKALYGYDANVIAAPMIPNTKQESVQQMLTKHQLHTELLKTYLTTAQNRIKVQADKQRNDRVFQVGEQVLLKLQPYAQTSVVNCSYPGLSFKFFGPHRVLDKVGKVAYMIDLPRGSLIHPVFHVSQMKPFTPNYTPVFSEMSVLQDFSQEKLAPEALLESRLVKKGNATTPQVSIKWQGLPDSVTTWEDWYVLISRFPKVAAWGQADSQAGGVVTHRG
jgi:hypothetical protein